MRSDCPAADDWAAMGVPFRYLNATPEPGGPPCSRLLWGPPGSGKTHRAVALLKTARGYVNSARFLALPEVQLARRAAVRVPTDQPLPGDLAIDRGFVVMDDIARDPRITDFWEEFVSGFVMARYNACKPTVFTSNFPLSEIAVRLGQHVTDRIAEMCGPNVEKMAAKDWRRP